MGYQVLSIDRRIEQGVHVHDVALALARKQDHLRWRGRNGGAAGVARARGVSGRRFGVCEFATLANLCGGNAPKT